MVRYVWSSDYMMQTIIITTSELKKKILRENSKRQVFYNLKFYTFSELKKLLFFDYDNHAIAFIMQNYQVNIAIAQMYLRNMYFLKDVDDTKVKFLLELKKELDEHNLLIYHANFKDFIKRQKIVVYGYPFLTAEEKLILKELDTQIVYEDNLTDEYIPSIYEASDIEEEVNFVCFKIASLIADSIPVTNIKIIATSEYEQILTRYLALYHIPVNKKSTHSFYSTLLAQDFLKHYDEYSISENILRISEIYANVNELVRIINLSATVSDEEVRKEFIIADLKRTKLKSPIYKEALEICDLKTHFNDDDYVFLLGFNVNNYPQIKRDIDYLSDKTKAMLGLDTSITENEYQKNTILTKLKRIKNLVITYKLNGPSGKYYPSVLINELGVLPTSIVIDKTISYAPSLSELEYAMALDDLYKYNIVRDTLALYQNSLTTAYFTYDNQFTGISKAELLTHLNHELNLSYTHMQMYNECAFRYYISKVLHLDIFEETFLTIIGSIMHHILEIGLTKEINIPVEIIQFVKDKDYKLNAKEYFYLDLLSTELANSLEVIKSQMKHSKLDNYLLENNFFVYKDQHDVKVTFKGTIDKVMYSTLHDKEVIAVVDYKTGSTIITLNDLAYGLHLQLPIYLYLLKKSERFSTSSIAGFYVQKVLFNKGNIEDAKTSMQVLASNMRLAGYTNSNEALMEMLDDNYQAGHIILNLKFKKDGSLSANSKVLSDEEMEGIITQVDQVIDKAIASILAGDFSINPKVLNKKNIACTYCKFKDLCFKKKSDEVVLGGKENEMDTEARVSN